MGSFLSGLLGSVTQTANVAACPGKCIHALASLMCDTVLEEVQCPTSNMRCCVEKSGGGGSPPNRDSSIPGLGLSMPPRPSGLHHERMNRRKKRQPLKTLRRRRRRRRRGGRRKTEQQQRQRLQQQPRRRLCQQPKRQRMRRRILRRAKLPTRVCPPHRHPSLNP